MTQAPGRILVVILNYNGLADTLACLKSLQDHPHPGAEILVIDNGSRQCNLNSVRKLYPEVELIALPDNLGWAGGNNVGMRLAMERGFDFVCLLNNDTVVEGSVFAALLAAHAAIGRPCLLTPAIAFFDAPEVWQVHGGIPDEAPAAVALERDHGIVRMSWAYGACLLIPASVMAAVGLLDERFFLQMEEMDYYHRCMGQGISSYCARRGRILHKESRSFGGRITEAKTYYQVRNSLLLAEKHERTPRALAEAAKRLLWSLYEQASASGAVLDGWAGFARWVASSDPLARSARQGVGDYLRRRFGRRPA